MLKHIILSSGDAALVVNDVVVMTADPAFENPSDLETVAEKLSEALKQPLQRIERQVPSADDWNWDDVLEEVRVDAAVTSGETAAKMMRNTTLVFLRHERFEVSNIGILNLKTSLESDSEVKKALVDATTHWVNTTKEGRNLWNDSSADLNIGDLASSGGLQSTEFIDALRQRGIEYVSCNLGDCESALSYDKVLVDRSAVAEEVTEATPQDSEQPRG